MQSLTTALTCFSGMDISSPYAALPPDTRSNEDMKLSSVPRSFMMQLIVRWSTKVARLEERLMIFESVAVLGLNSTWLLFSSRRVVHSVTLSTNLLLSND
jgi:hypothetical protein